MAEYTKIPAKAKVKPTPFTARISDEKLKRMLDLVRTSPIGIETYENTGKTSESYGEWGLSREWLLQAKDEWLNNFDWRAHEERINSYPNYTLDIKDDQGHTFTMHFIALFSENEHAIPIAFYHGWPGSFLEFLDMLDVVKAKYSAAELPYHIIVPSLPGYTFSSGPSVDKDADTWDMAQISYTLLHELGFQDTGYIAQGGDLGSYVARTAAQFDDACKAYHLNMYMMPPPANANDLPLTDIEKEAFPRIQKWMDTGTAYAQEQGTRTATLGLVLSSSPMALLAWIGEKFLEWSDQDPPLDRILESVSLYWLTDTFSRCIYPYRSNYGPHRAEIREKTKFFENSCKPMGYSWHPKELSPVPISWIKTKTNLVHYKHHKSGGHFAALENPARLFADVEDFAQIVWQR